MASESVLKYLVDTNRPYSCADVTVNLRGAFTKSAVQKALDLLSESGKIKCKLYGKQKVYAAIQPEDVGGDVNIEDYEAQFKSLTQELTDKTNAVRVAETKLKNLVSVLTTDVAKSQIVEVKNRLDILEKKIDTLKGSTEVISPEEKKKILNKHEILVREYRKRKRACSDMLDAVLEGYPKSKKCLLEELCIETDEMVDFKLMGE